jgi:hypothetical protein
LASSKGGSHQHHHHRASHQQHLVLVDLARDVVAVGQHAVALATAGDAVAAGAAAAAAAAASRGGGGGLWAGALRGVASLGGGGSGGGGGAGPAGGAAAAASFSSAPSASAAAPADAGTDATTPPPPPAAPAPLSAGRWRLGRGGGASSAQHHQPTPPPPQLVHLPGVPLLPGAQRLLDAIAPHHAALRSASARAASGGGPGGGGPGSSPSFFLFRPPHELTDAEADAARSLLLAAHEHLDAMLGDLRPHVIVNVGLAKRTGMLLPEALADAHAPRDRPFVRAFVETQMFAAYSDAIIRDYVEDA